MSVTQANGVGEKGISSTSRLNGHAAYSVPEESKKLLVEGILQNPLIAKGLPEEIMQCAENIHFEGSDKPSLPINWRFAESISSLKGFEAAMVNALLLRKYGVQPPKVTINTDHAQLFFMSTIVWTIDPKGKNVSSFDSAAKIQSFFPNWDRHEAHTTLHRSAVTNIYKTMDDRYFHLHGSMNPDPSLESIGLPPHRETTDFDDSIAPFVEKLSKISSSKMQDLASIQYRQAGTICWTMDEFRNSDHGKANAQVGLYELKSIPNPAQKPCWWQDCPQTSAKRPLAGLKIVDITRVIAAPAVTRGLAELGASVMRVTAPHLTDYSSLHVDLNWGKWNTCLDFRKEEDREKMRALILEADVVVQGYRPGVLDKYGFGIEGILDLCKDRKRGIIVARENCYGWYGPWAFRSGWQQISDACCGVSMEYGRAMGNDEAVTPVFPNSDYCTGVAGVTGVLDALMRRAQDGGSYQLDIALNYYSQWLVNSCGVYPDSIWKDVWERNGSPVFRHYHPMLYTLPRFLAMMHENSKDTLLRDEFFELRHTEAVGVDIRTVKPILRYDNGEVELKYNVGTRSNGVDKPVWPADLMTEIVA